MSEHSDRWTPAMRAEASRRMHERRTWEDSPGRTPKRPTFSHQALGEALSHLLPAIDDEAVA